MSLHLKGYQKSITLIKTGRLKQNNANQTFRPVREVGHQLDVRQCCLVEIVMWAEVYRL